MTAAPRIEGYAWTGGRETSLRWGPDDGPVVVAALPLLEEANRTRAFVTTVLRALAEQGIGGMLPELPGQGESMLLTELMTLPDLRAAFAAAAKELGSRPVFAMAVRSGALLIDAAKVRGRWLLAPQTGDEVLKEWRRLGAGDDGEVVEIAGNRIARSLLEALAGANPAGGDRVVRLASDSRDADLKIEADPIWRRAEPDNDFMFAQRLADDIADWIATCAV